MNDSNRYRTQRGPIRAPRGTELSARSWLTEAPLRMLMNNLDPDVAERPDELVVYGGIGRAARDWESYDRIVHCLRQLGDDETLLVQSGKPVGVFRTHADAPRVLIANSNLVGRWATWEHFHELDRKGLMMYGQMTAGSWIYIGSQGIVQGTYETFVEMGRQHLRRQPRRQVDPHRGTRRHGWRAAARGDDGRRLDARDRVPPRSHQEAARDALPRRRRRIARRSARTDRACDARRQGDLRRPARQRGGSAARTAATRRASRRRDRPDVGARSGERLPARGLDRRAVGPGASQRSGSRRKRGAQVDGEARAGDAGVPEARHPDVRLRQQHPPGRVRRGRQERVRLSRLRARVRAAAVLPRHRPVPLGCAVGRSRGHLPHRRRR